MFLNQQPAILSSANLIFNFYMQAINLRKFKKKFEEKRKSLRRFITRIENNPPPNLEAIAENTEKKFGHRLIVLVAPIAAK